MNGDIIELIAIKPKNMSKSAHTKIWIGISLVVGLVIVGLIWMNFRGHRYMSMSAKDQYKIFDEYSQSLNESAIFEIITENKWCMNSGTPGYPSRKQVLFKQNGTYSWTHSEDFGPVKTEGLWSIRKESKSGGLMLVKEESRNTEFSSGLEDGVVRFAINKNDRLIILGSGEYESCGRNDVNTPYFIPEIPMNELYNQITANEWRIIDESQIDYMPTSIVFNRNGTYKAIHNNGECVELGYWSIAGDEVSTNTESQCDSRYDYRGKSTLRSSNIEFKNGNLFFQRTYFEPE